MVFVNESWSFGYKRKKTVGVLNFLECQKTYNFLECWSSMIYLVMI